MNDIREMSEQLEKNDEVLAIAQDAQTMLNCLLLVKKLLHEDKKIGVPGNEKIFSENRLNRVISGLTYEEPKKEK